MSSNSVTVPASTATGRRPKVPKVKYRRMTITKNRACTRDVFRDLYSHPEDLRTIGDFNIMELDAEYLRKLLSLDMPNLEGINLGAPISMCSELDEGRKRELNRRLVAKPNLKTFNFICDDRQETYRMTLQDVPLLNHPSLKTLKLQRLMIDVFAQPSVRSLPFENLDSFYLHTGEYSFEILNKFLKNAKSLRHLEFHHPFDVSPHRDPPDFPELLQPCKGNLKILELWWDCRESICFNGAGMKFAEFTALQYLAIPPRALFGSYYWEKDLDFLQMLKDHIPPNLKVLFLQDIYPCWLEEKFPLGVDPEGVLLPNDYELIKTMLINAELFPSLKYIVWTSEIGTIPPEDLDDLGADLGITLEWLTDKSELMPDQKWLDKL
ncbi:hypothetical protein F53441_3089 [Fusarium austroafricanum]|uniref:Uncharacterized protein n=1 Tax=Fusarium austroafricanum TaxID=2364996 RepID=A0A8H4KNG5_9HYPO|nr:hypothetical protein F53441_3089 [Fusarium austroafricanum]